MLRRLLIQLIVVATLVGAPRTSTAAQLIERTWTIEGVARKALVHFPAGAGQPAVLVPVVFAFHGHGGTAAHAARSFPVHERWPEAIVVYPQGLPTAGKLTDREGRLPGWQPAAGTQGDRDLKFFDTMLADLLARSGADPRRVYAMGHSNGGGFTYLLWAERGSKLAAVAPSAAVIGQGARKLTPKPVLHLGSPQDELVKFSWQRRMIGALTELNGVPDPNLQEMGYREYTATGHATVALYLHTGGHKFPSDAVPLIVKFFQAHAAP